MDSRADNIDSRTGTFQPKPVPNIVRSCGNVPALFAKLKTGPGLLVPVLQSSRACWRAQKIKAMNAAFILPRTPRSLLRLLVLRLFKKWMKMNSAHSSASKKQIRDCSTSACCSTPRTDRTGLRADSESPRASEQDPYRQRGEFPIIF